jgi:hypothetical protein
MSPIVQTDTRLNEQINRAGCLYRSLQMLAEIHARRTLTPDDIMALYTRAVEGGTMREDCFVLDHAAIIRAAQATLGMPPKARYVFRRTPEDKAHDFDIKVPPSAFIRHYKTANGFGHFVVADRFGHVQWDPYWPPTDASRDLSFRGYSL